VLALLPLAVHAQMPTGQPATVGRSATTVAPPVTPPPPPRPIGPVPATPPAPLSAPPPMTTPRSSGPIPSAGPAKVPAPPASTAPAKVYDRDGRIVPGMRPAGPNRVFDTRTGRYLDSVPAAGGQQVRP